MAESYIQSPPDSSGKRVHARIENDGINDIYTPIHHLADRHDHSLLQSVDNEGAAKVSFAGGSPAFDVFGRTTVSEPNLMAMYKFYHRDYAEEFEKKEVGGALIARDNALKMLKLTCGTAAGDIAEYHSHRHFHYRPGNSMTAIWTMKVGDTGKTNVTRWAGFRTELDGIYFEIVDSNIFVVIKNGSIGGEERVAVSAWNGDRLDGFGGETNLSGATLSTDALSIWWIDFQYLGAGAVRFGTYVNGQKVVCHTVGHYGALDRPYLASPALSIAFGQENTGVTGSSSEMHVGCAVITNDGYDEFDRRPVSISAEKTITTTTHVPVLSFRPTASFHGVDNRARILPQVVSVLAEGGSIEIIATAVPTLIGDAWGNSVSGTEYDTAATSLSGGEVKTSTYVANGRSETIDLSSIFKINIDGITRHYTPATTDIITISARLLNTGSATAAISLNVIEIE